MANQLKNNFGLWRLTARGILALAVLLSVSSEAYASTAPGLAFAQSVQQSRQVKGHIVDETGEPLIGVTVRVAGTSIGTVTDIDGNYTIQVPGGKNELELSYTGYKSRKISVAHPDAALEPDALGLDEVVVVGYGTVKKKDLTGAVTTMKTEDITISPTNDVMESLQGKVAGLDITKSSGELGGGVKVLLAVPAPSMAITPRCSSLTDFRATTTK